MLAPRCIHQGGWRHPTRPTHPSTTPWQGGPASGAARERTQRCPTWPCPTMPPTCGGHGSTYGRPRSSSPPQRSRWRWTRHSTHGKRPWERTCRRPHSGPGGGRCRDHDGGRGPPAPIVDPAARREAAAQGHLFRVANNHLCTDNLLFVCGAAALRVSTPLSHHRTQTMRGSARWLMGFPS